MRDDKFVFAYELKKIFGTKTTVLTILISSLILFVVSIQNYLTMPDIQNSWADEQVLDGQAIDNTFLQNAGASLHDDNQNNPYRFVLKYINWTTESMEGLNNRMGEIDVKNISEEQFYERRNAIISQIMDTYFLADEEKGYWRKEEARIEKPFIYRSSQSALGMWDSYMWKMVLGCFAIAICLSGVFAGEHSHKTDAMIYGTVVGYRRLCLIKLSAGMLFSLVIGMTFLLIGHIPIFIYSGLHGLDGAWQLIRPFSLMAKNIGEMLLIYTVIYLLSCILTGIIVMVLSMVFNNAIATMGAMVAFVLIDLMIGPPTSLRVLSQIKALTPVGVLKNSFVPDYRLVMIGGLHLTVYHAAILLYIAISIIMVFIMFKTYKRKTANI